jgi:hypothetical protein
MAIDTVLPHSAGMNWHIHLDSRVFCERRHGDLALVCAPDCTEKMDFAFQSDAITAVNEKQFGCL